MRLLMGVNRGDGPSLTHNLKSFFQLISNFLINGLLNAFDSSASGKTSVRQQ